MANTNSGREFIKLAFANHLSHSAAFLLMLVVAGRVMQSRGSAWVSAVVFGLAYIMPCLLSARVGALIDRRISRAFLMVLNSLSLAAGMSILLLDQLGLSLFLVYAVIAFQSLLTMSHRTACLKWMKAVTPPGKHQQPRARLLFLGVIGATFTSGLLLMCLGLNNSVAIAIVIGAFYGANVFVGASLEAYCAPPQRLPEGSRVGILKTVGDVLRDKRLRYPFLIVVASSSVFQGAYGALVAALPRHCHLPLAVFQLAASVGLLSAFVLVWRHPNIVGRGQRQTRRRTMLVALSAIVCLVIATHSSSAWMSALSFGAMMLLFEVLWITNQARFVAALALRQTGRFLTTVDSLNAALIGIATMTLGGLLTLYGLAAGTEYFLLAALLLAISAATLNYLTCLGRLRLVTQQRRQRRRRSEPAGEPMETC